MATMTGQESEVQGRRSSGATAKTLLSVGGVLAALGASSCCVVPFALFMLGVSGAWIGNLTALAPYQPIFVAVALACLGAGVVLLDRRSSEPAATCEPGSYCATPIADRVARIGLWIAAAIVALALVFPRLATLFLD
jgi:mercuric ion transport protein